jgi:hypothetical protein
MTIKDFIRPLCFDNFFSEQRVHFLHITKSDYFTITQNKVCLWIADNLDNLIG